MSWVRLDDGFTEHPKILALADREVIVHIRALCYAARRRDCHITPQALRVLGASKKTAERLAEVGVWDVNSDGWVIHDWEKYQRVDATNAERQRKHRQSKVERDGNDA